MISFKKEHFKSYLVALCSIVYFVSYFARKDFAATMAAMITDGTIDKIAGGFIGTGLFICYGVGQLVSGYLGDRIKPSYLILFGLGTTSVCNLLMPLVPAGMAMIPVWAVNGFAQAMLWPPIVRILSENLDHEKFVKANLIVTSAAHISTILLYLYVPLCLEYFSWKTVFFTATVLALFAAAMLVISLILVLPRDAIKAPMHKSQKNEPDGVNYTQLVIRAGIIPVFICIVMMGILRDGIESWLPTLYAEAFNREATESILVSVVLPIFSILSIVIITALHKTRTFNNEVRGSVILFAISAAIAVPIALIINSDSLAVRILCLILACAICACMHGCNFLLISCLPGRFSEYGRAATTSGFCNAFTYVGAAVSSYGMGAISEHFGWQTTVFSWAGVGAVGIIFTLISLKTYTRFIKKEQDK